MFGAIGHVFRLSGAALTLASHDLLLPREYVERLPWGTRLLGRVTRFFLPKKRGTQAARLAEALERLGPAYVKLGQFLATRPDIIGADAAEELSRLKDRMPGFSREQALDALNSEFGQTEILFGTVSDPIAAASIAQVHIAILPDGTKRAVKVLRPRIEKRLQRDFEALAFGATLVELFRPKLRRLEPRALIETVHRSVERELDLRLEAAACDEFRELMAADGLIVVPQIDWSRTARRVMTLTWVEGATLTDLAALDRVHADRKALALAITRTFLASALDHGFFHADLHEGNLILGPDGKLNVVDFGIMGRINAAERRYLAEILYGFLRRDYRRVSEVHFAAGYVGAPHSVEDFALALRAVGEPIFGKTADELSMGRVLLQLFDTTRLFGMRLRPELVLLQKTMVQVEGVARTIDPTHDMWEAARPIVERWVRRELGPEGMAKRAGEELRGGWDAIRKLPAAVNAVEAAAAQFAGIKPPQGYVNPLAIKWGQVLIAAAIGAIVMAMLR